MAIKIERTTRVTLGKIKWNIVDSDIIKSDKGDDFVAIGFVQRNHGFTRIVARDCVHLPEAMPSQFSMGRSIGMHKLTELRNDVQSRSVMSSVCTNMLFGAAAPIFGVVRKQESTRASVRSHASKKAGRGKGETLVIRIQPYGDNPIATELEVMRPLHPTDRLAVRVDEASLTAVVSFIRFHGFTETLKKTRDDALPNGVWRVKKRSKCYVVCDKKDGKKRMKYYSDLCEAQGAMDLEGDIADAADGSDGATDASENDIAEDAVESDEAGIEVDGYGEA
jgi:hypothetical protein